VNDMKEELEKLKGELDNFHQNARDDRKLQAAFLYEMMVKIQEELKLYGVDIGITNGNDTSKTEW
tara:strand:+ start:1713 stop:1907 length:195 start_codon:yes stop_codon:yes gene_type:complete